MRHKFLKIIATSAICFSLFAINLYAQDDFTLGNYNSLSDSAQTLITNQAIYQLYMEKNRISDISQVNPTDLANFKPDAKSYSAAIEKATNNFIASGLKETDNSQIKFQLNGKEYTAPPITPNDNFTALKAQGSEAITNALKEDAEAKVIEQYVKQYGDIANLEQFKQLLAIETDPVKALENLKAMGWSDAEIQKYKDNIASGNVAVGVATINPAFIQFGMQIGCNSPQQLLSYIKNLSDSNGYLSSLLDKNTSFEYEVIKNPDGTESYNFKDPTLTKFMQTTSATQQFLSSSWAAIWKQAYGISGDMINGLGSEFTGGTWVGDMFVPDALYTGNGHSYNPNAQITITSEIKKNLNDLIATYEKMNLDVGHLKSMLNKKQMTAAEMQGWLKEFSRLTGASMPDSKDSKKYEIIYKGLASENINEGVYKPTETHTYLSRIEYTIRKEDKSNFDKVNLTWSPDLMNYYMDLLESFPKGKSASNVYRKWITAINMFNDAYGKNIPAQFPTVSMANGGTVLSGKMDFEDFIASQTGGSTNNNVVAQDFFRNYYSDISSKTYSSVYRTAFKEYARLQVRHDNTEIYNRQNVDLSYISCPMAFKLDSGSLVYGYEIVIKAYLKQIVNESWIIASDGTASTRSAVSQLLQYFPYRQYMEIKTCKYTTPQKVDYAYLQEHYIPNIASKVNTDTIENLNIERTQDGVGVNELAGSRSHCYMLCDDDTHSNLYLKNLGEKVSQKETATEPAKWGKSLHIHSVQLSYGGDDATCETAQRLKGYPFREWFSTNSTSVPAILTDNICGGFTIQTRVCDGQHSVSGTNKRPVPCPNCGSTASRNKKCKNHKVGTEDVPFTTPLHCSKCGGTGENERFVLAYIDVNQGIIQWNQHKGKCFKIHNDSSTDAQFADKSINDTSTYIGIKDASTERNYKGTDAERAARVGKVKDYKQLKWYYKGKIYTWGNSGGYIVIFDDIVSGKGVQVENFISM